jgi:hypothetical protein
MPVKEEMNCEVHVQNVFGETFISPIPSDDSFDEDDDVCADVTGKRILFYLFFILFRYQYQKRMIVKTALKAQTTTI